MELEKFVTETMTAVLKGIEATEEQTIKKQKYSVHPGVGKEGAVNFDLVIIYQQGKIHVASSTQVKPDATSSRIKFSVPIYQV